MKFLQLSFATGLALTAASAFAAPAPKTALQIATEEELMAQLNGHLSANADLKAAEANIALLQKQAAENNIKTVGLQKQVDDLTKQLAEAQAVAKALPPATPPPDR